MCGPVDLQGSQFLSRAINSGLTLAHCVCCVCSPTDCRVGPFTLPAGQFACSKHVNMTSAVSNTYGVFVPRRAHGTAGTFDALHGIFLLLTIPGSCILFLLACFFSFGVFGFRWVTFLGTGPAGACNRYSAGAWSAYRDLTSQRCISADAHFKLL